MDQSNRKVSKGGISGVVAIIAFCLLIGVLLWLDQNYKSTHYRQGTQIQGLDCSKLSVEEAKEKIENREIVFTFSNGKIYSTTAKELGATIDNLSEQEEFLNEQQEDEEDLSFTLSEKSWSVDSMQVKNFLKTIPELKKENMRQPTNAHLEFVDTGVVQIISEVEGNYIELEDACNLAISNLKQSATFIDFEEAMRVIPDITATNRELTAEANRLNKILNAKITFELEQGETLTLSYDSAIKDWVKVEGDEITIDVDGNLRAFVESLYARVYELGETFECETPDGEFISVPVADGEENRVDIEAEIIQIKSELEKGANTSREPIYAHRNMIDPNGDVLFANLEKQWLKYYKDGKLFQEGPFVSGTKGTRRETPRGLDYIDADNKQSPKEFIKYGGKSEYWLPLKHGDGIGFHDAPWRDDSEFVPETADTDGSHGCYNCQEPVVEPIYMSITSDTLVITY